MDEAVWVMMDISSDRIISLKPIDDTKPVSSIGVVDPRLFVGKNKLHAVLENATGLWSMYYESGILPQPLQQRFTSFKKLYDHVESYFIKRNIQVVEIKDANPSIS